MRRITIAIVLDEDRPVGIVYRAMKDIVAKIGRLVADAVDVEDAAVTVRPADAADKAESKLAKIDAWAKAEIATIAGLAREGRLGEGPAASRLLLLELRQMIRENDKFKRQRAGSTP